ncbi:Mor transcription activator family protein [Acidovorax sp.]|uniref:Mor transcription activator family protein n=1 Tax=Acidovorax sp. TaxID=1872122 RepID=UPI002ACDE9E2|nr:Mor transcription activator family protein [Acidovorax sp.]MDZ7862633.1 Mor transcription activator family protein [Acidovorax sp.]
MIRPETRTSIRRHELLADLVDVVTRRLRENGVSPNEAEIVANDLADHLAKHWGGQVIPFPKDLRRELTRLELEIYGKFLGDNYDDLARQYDMTMSGMRKLIARIRAKLAADVQNDLFDPIRAA